MLERSVSDVEDKHAADGSVSRKRGIFLVQGRRGMEEKRRGEERGARSLVVQRAQFPGQSITGHGDQRDERGQGTSRNSWFHLRLPWS